MTASGQGMHEEAAGLLGGTSDCDPRHSLVWVPGLDMTCAEVETLAGEGGIFWGGSSTLGNTLPPLVYMPHFGVQSRCPPTPLLGSTVPGGGG